MPSFVKDRTILKTVCALTNFLSL